MVHIKNVHNVFYLLAYLVQNLFRRYWSKYVWLYIIEDADYIKLFNCVVSSDDSYVTGLKTGYAFLISTNVELCQIPDAGNRMPQ